MWLLMTNSMRARPDSIGRYAPPAKRRRWIGKIEHDLGARRRNSGEIEIFGLEIGDAIIDESLIALRAGHGDDLFVVQHMRRVAGPDDRWQSELAADNGRM